MRRIGSTRFLLFTLKHPIQALGYRAVSVMSAETLSTQKQMKQVYLGEAEVLGPHISISSPSLGLSEDISPGIYTPV